MDTSIEGIDIIEDAHDVIRRNPDLYAGPAPRGPRLANALMSDLIAYGDLPATVERRDGWWLIGSEGDWLARPARDGRDYWNNLIPTPEVGAHGMRCEVVLRALCRGLMSATRDRSELLVGEASSVPESVSFRVASMLRERSSGRVVAFCVD
jgi:hypothetical protein